MCRMELPGAAGLAILRFVAGIRIEAFGEIDSCSLSALLKTFGTVWDEQWHKGPLILIKQPFLHKMQRVEIALERNAIRAGIVERGKCRS